MCWDRILWSQIIGRTLHEQGIKRSPNFQMKFVLPARSVPLTQCSADEVTPPIPEVAGLCALHSGFPIHVWVITRRHDDSSPRHEVSPIEVAFLRPPRESRYAAGGNIDTPDSAPCHQKLLQTPMQSRCTPSIFFSSADSR